MSNSRQISVNQLPSLSRRDFMKFSGGCAALSSTSLLSTLVNLKLTNSAVAAAGDTSGYKALVCVFLLGGVDSFNVLVPNEPAEYADYATIRSNLALPQANLLSITDTQPGSGRKFGIHPGMPEVRDLYNQGKLAFIPNIGSLIEPTDKTNYSNGAKLPLGLFSHSDLIRHWQTSVPQSRSQITGWGGRMADILTDTVNADATLSMNVALNSVNVFQTGLSVVPYVVGSGGATTLSGYTANPTGTGQNAIYSRISNDILTDSYSDLLEKSYAKTQRGSIDTAIEFNNVTNAVQSSLTNGEFDTPFPKLANGSYTSLAGQLRRVALTIGARDTLKQRRQIFFVSFGGWDHHDEVINAQAGMLPQVSQALNAFYKATEQLGVANDVTTFTASDFARTLSSNGNGSDHAWGGNHLVMGGKVTGGRFYGTYPTSLKAGAPLDLGRGRLIPTTSVDAYNAEMACWFGVPNDNNLEAILPNIRNFYAAGGSSGPMGFLS